MHFNQIRKVNGQPLGTPVQHFLQHFAALVPLQTPSRPMA
jgi:hypothetical protein